MKDRIPHQQAMAPASAVVSLSPQHDADMEPPVTEAPVSDVDEPPDHRLPFANDFKRGPVPRRGSEHESLLSKALHSHSDDDAHDSGSVVSRPGRRRSVTSTISMASSTADLTCDTAISTPPRTLSPSPAPGHRVFKAPTPAPSPMVRAKKPASAVDHVSLSTDPAVQALQKKRCISFACDSRPKTSTRDSALVLPSQRPQARASVSLPKEEPAPKRMTIKFACCPRRPRDEPSLLAAPLASRMPSPLPARRSRSPVAERTTKRTVVDAKDPRSDSARFYEFASDEPHEDDWIRKDDSSAKRKITIGDTLQKENAIRKLAREAEEEADIEELDLDDENLDDADVSDAEIDDEAGLCAEEDDNDSAYGTDEEPDEAGYCTDNEGGFGVPSDDEDDDLFWPAAGPASAMFASAAAKADRRRSLDELSSSSGASRASRGLEYSTSRGAETQPLAFRHGTPELPDSTDFVCGTLDEDRPLEDAYLSCVAARRREKMHLIPQDIDPSFPTSEPEDEADEQFHTARDNSDDNAWLHGSLEDIHASGERGMLSRGRSSPKRCRSPPLNLKRLRSPPPQLKSRGRSPRRFLSSPTRHLKPPAPHVHQLGLGKARTGLDSPSNLHQGSDRGIVFQTTAMPLRSLGHTKYRPSSVPRTTSTLMFAPGHSKGATHRKAGRPGGSKHSAHVRGAIDIVKGLEQKRQRRKEKFYQRYCTRARKEKKAGHDRERKLAPGEGVERMRQVGLLTAGKKVHYVISF